MSKPVFRVVGLDQATCDIEYGEAQTSTKSKSPTMLDTCYSEEQPSNPQTVQLRLGDVLPVLQASATERLAWVQDCHDDPIVITKDLYEVLLTYRRLRHAA